MDASKHGMGATIIQESRPVVYVSKLFNSTERMTDERDMRETTRSRTRRLRPVRTFQRFSANTQRLQPRLLWSVTEFFQFIFNPAFLCRLGQTNGVTKALLFLFQLIALNFHSTSPQKHLKHTCTFQSSTTHNCTPLPFLEQKKKNYLFKCPFLQPPLPCTYQILSYSGLQSTLREKKKKSTFHDQSLQ